MKPKSARKAQSPPLMLSSRHEQLLRAVHEYRFVTAQDITRLLFSKGSLTYVRSQLSALAGGKDHVERQYLYRFPLPTGTRGNQEKAYTLGGLGRDFLAEVVGVPVDWYFRPDKVRHMSFIPILHHLMLTRFVISAKCWSRQQSAFNLAESRLSYEIAKVSASVKVTVNGKTTNQKVIPDAWLLFEKLQDGAVDGRLPILLEIDRGMEYQQKFKQHVASRIEFVQSGEYTRVFGRQAVRIVYITSGQFSAYREDRRKAMMSWTQDVLKDLKKESWGNIFRFGSLVYEELFDPALFEQPLWYRPDSSEPIQLLTT